MRIAIIGGTGFVGGYLIDALFDAGHDVTALVRPGSAHKLCHGDRVRAIEGELASAEAIDGVCEGCDAVIYLVGILREFPRRGITFEQTQYLGVVSALKAAKKHGVTTFVLMSANGVRAGGTPYQDTKFRAEEAVRASGIGYTIFRPSVIFGNPHGLSEIATQLHRDMVAKPLPAVAFHTGWRPSAGPIMMSPVHVEDVADAFVAALHMDTLNGETIALGGPEALSWRQLIERVAGAVHKRKWFLPMPIGLFMLAAGCLDWIPAFPATRNQLKMLAQGNEASSAPLARILGRSPKRFDANALEYLRS